MVGGGPASRMCHTKDHHKNVANCLPEYTVEPLLRGHLYDRTTPLERPLFWCKSGGLTKGVPLYIFSIVVNSYHILKHLVYLI